MADKIEPVVETPTEPQVIKVGDREYKPEELQELVGKAGKVAEFEKKAGTDFDALTESWGKRGQRIGDLEKELEAFKKPPVKTEDGELTPEQVKEQARKLGIVTKEDLESFLDLRDQGRTLYKSCQKLETKIDGKDGRPAFKTGEILEYMKENGVKSADIAYKLKYEKELDQWKEAELGKKRPSGLQTETSSSAGGKQPTPVKVTRDNLDQMVRESLNGRI